jgi:hypothetical protein
MPGVPEQGAGGQVGGSGRRRGERDFRVPRERLAGGLQVRGLHLQPQQRRRLHAEEPLAGVNVEVQQAQLLKLCEAPQEKVIAVLWGRGEPPVTPGDGLVGDPDHVAEHPQRRAGRDDEGVDELPVDLIPAVAFHGCQPPDVEIQHMSGQSWAAGPAGGRMAARPIDGGT